MTQRRSGPAAGSKCPAEAPGEIATLRALIILAGSPQFLCWGLGERDLSSWKIGASSIGSILIDNRGVFMFALVDGRQTGGALILGISG
jgi:hypothetical protein